MPQINPAALAAALNNSSLVQPVADRPPVPNAAQNDENMSTVDMPDRIFDALKNIGNRPVEDYPPALEYEKIVDDHIARNKLNPGDKFRVEHPDGTRLYQVIKPDEGSRKSWYEIRRSVPTS